MAMIANPVEEEYDFKSYHIVLLKMSFSTKYIQNMQKIVSYNLYTGKEGQ